MATTRQRAIAEHLERLQSGLNDLENRERQTREDLAWIVKEIERYKELISDTKKHADDERVYLSSVPHRKLDEHRSVISISGADVKGSFTVGGRTREMSKTDEIRFAAVKILAEFGQPLKRYDLTQRLLERGLMQSSSNPVDLVRKALHKHSEISFDQSTGYFLAASRKHS